MLSRRRLELLEVRPILLESDNNITFAAMDIISFLVSAWMMSGVLAPFSTLKAFSAKIYCVAPRRLVLSPRVQWLKNCSPLFLGAENTKVRQRE